ncbi:MAG: hypothetical protein WCQ21_18250, partial [Verrucomicrobiota bacterium]
PVVNVTVPGGPVTITESAEALFRAIALKKQLFYRGGVVVELVNEDEGGHWRRKQPIEHRPCFARFFSAEVNYKTEPR